MEALRKMTLLPARRLEGVSPVMACKGRIKVGCDADVTIFDLSRILDKASYDMPDEYSTGIEHVLVAGTAVVKDGRLVEGVKPGKPVFSHYGLNLEERRLSQGERESN
jgi:N-acyl-D-aspartate/D-glutamate deacylase